MWGSLAGIDQHLTVSCTLIDINVNIDINANVFIQRFLAHILFMLTWL